ncbi:aldehyde dehydrogenase [Phellopilus nigrolimitatus]|nr:aldehyde dehydrogenase [Phellopilus nigrolimitatus]
MVNLRYSTVQEIDEHHETLYNTFRAGTCRPLDYRRAQLHKLARMCQENADALADALFADLGKPKVEVFAFEVGQIVKRSLLCAEKLAEWAAPEKVNTPDWQKPWNSTLIKAPKGPVLIISPWNYPIMLSLQPLYAAIAAGCPAIVKPSELAPTYAQLLADLVPKYLDPKTYAVVNGAVPETTKLLELRWAHIFYTGNGRVGRIVATAAAKHLTPCSLELGGKSPVIVDAAYDMDIAAARILFGKANNAGQTCVAPDYVLIPRSAQDTLIAALERVYAERYPDGALASASYGRIVNATHFGRLTELLARSKGRRVLGGETDEARLKIAPTVLADVTTDDALLEEELFGPILPIVPVADIDEAIEIVNSRDSPLAFYAFTEQAEVKQKLVERTLSGSLIFNETFDQLAVIELPFSGVGESGYGYHVMKYGFDGFTHLRSSMDVPKESEELFATRYAPYTDEKLEKVSKDVFLNIPLS